MSENNLPIKIIHLEPGPPDDPIYTHNYERETEFPEPIRGAVTIKLSRRIERRIGCAGRLLSGSKSTYAHRFPDHEVLFNACIFDGDGTEVWFGDVDLTLEAATLQALADELGVIHVTPEWPFRVEGLPDATRAGDGERIRTFKPAQPRDEGAGRRRGGAGPR